MREREGERKGGRKKGINKRKGGEGEGREGEGRGREGKLAENKNITSGVGEVAQRFHTRHTPGDLTPSSGLCRHPYTHDIHAHSNLLKTNVNI